MVPHFWYCSYVFANDAGVVHEEDDARVVLPRKIARDGLMQLAREEAIEPSAERVVRIARLLGERVVHVVRDHVDLFGHDAHREVANHEAINRVAERERAVRAVAMQPDDVDRAEADHRVEEADRHELPREELHEEEDRERDEREVPRPSP